MVLKQHQAVAADAEMPMANETALQDAQGAELSLTVVQDHEIIPRALIFPEIDCHFRIQVSAKVTRISKRCQRLRCRRLASEIQLVKIKPSATKSRTYWGLASNS